MHANITAKILALLILVLPLGGMARTWTDDEIGQQLLAMTVQRDTATVNKLIAFAQDGPQAELLQRFLWQKLSEVGPSEMIDNYAKATLNNQSALPGMKFGALSYLAYAPQDWMREYAVMAVDPAQDPKVRAIGFYLAATLAMTEQRDATVAFADTYQGSDVVYALMAIAEWQTVDYINSHYGGHEDQDALITALDYAKFVSLSDTDKRDQGYMWLRSGNDDLAISVLQKALRGNHVDWLSAWHIAAINVTPDGDASVVYKDDWYEAYIRTLGYRLIPVAKPGSTNEFSLGIQALDRREL